MGTLWSELAPLADDAAAGPRIYADANVPAGLVGYMRESLGWDVLFVVEHQDLRRARDLEHYRLARQLRRTLVTLDRDYLDDREFPPRETAGVIVISAPDERGLRGILDRVDREMFYRSGDALVPLPLDGCKVQVFPEFGAGSGR